MPGFEEPTRRMNFWVRRNYQTESAPVWRQMSEISNTGRQLKPLRDKTFFWDANSFFSHSSEIQGFFEFCPKKPGCKIPGFWEWDFILSGMKKSYTISRSRLEIFIEQNLKFYDLSKPYLKRGEPCLFLHVFRAMKF